MFELVLYAYWAGGSVRPEPKRYPTEAACKAVADQQRRTWEHKVKELSGPFTIYTHIYCRPVGRPLTYEQLATPGGWECIKYGKCHQRAKPEVKITNPEEISR